MDSEKSIIGYIIGLNVIVGFFALFIGLYAILVNVKTSLNFNAPLFWLMLSSAILVAYQALNEREINTSAHKISRVVSVIGMIAWLWLPLSEHNLLVQWKLFSLSPYYLYWITTYGQPIFLFVLLLFLMLMSLTAKPKLDTTRTKKLWFYLTPIVLAGWLLIYSLKMVQLGYFYHFAHSAHGKLFQYKRNTTIGMLLHPEFKQCTRPTFYVKV